MSLYGNKEIARKAIAEWHAAEWRGLETITNAKSECESVQIFTTKEDGNAYLATSDLEKYMEASGVWDAQEAIDTLKEHYNLENINICYDSCSDFIYEDLWECTNIVFETSVEDDAQSVGQIKKWYNKFIDESKKAESIEEIDEKIKLLEKCVSNMKKSIEKGDTEGRIKYALKDWIPFNWVYRLAKRKDFYGFASLLGNVIIPGSSVIVRAVLYNKMLESQITKAENAIDFLKEKKEELKKKKD